LLLAQTDGQAWEATREFSPSSHVWRYKSAAGVREVLLAAPKKERIYCRPRSFSSVKVYRA